MISYLLAAALQVACVAKIRLKPTKLLKQLDQCIGILESKYLDLEMTSSTFNTYY